MPMPFFFFQTFPWADPGPQQSLTPSLKGSFLHSSSSSPNLPGAFMPPFNFPGNNLYFPLRFVFVSIIRVKKIKMKGYLMVPDCVCF